MNPSAYTPTKPAEFIGPARTIAKTMIAKADRLKSGGGCLKVLFYGPPGSGKSALAKLTARALAGHQLAIEQVNGKEVGIETVHAWMGELSCGSLFGDWQVKIIDELDLCSKDAQNLLLTYLDRLPPNWAFIGTSNLQLDLLAERFQSRLQQFKVDAPTEDALATFVYEVTNQAIEAESAFRIAAGAGGNVRAALLDAESYLDVLAASVSRKGGRK